ncbi:MAG: response regulator [Campylobacterales bacterium]|nr:response regulator [Campylobacterales bacterium]
MKWKVLCVDDMPSNLFTYESILSRIEAIEVILASSGKEAFDKLLKHKIDLILLDIQMPQMDGYEVAKLLKSNNMTKAIPIIFITAVFKKEEFITKGFALGAIDYLTKPIDDILLVNRIRLYLDIFTQKDLANANMQRFYEIAQSVGDGLYVLDKNYRVSFINDVALKMLRYKKEELLHKEIHSIIHYRDQNGTFRPSNMCQVHSLFETAQPLNVDDDILIQKDGTSIPVSIVATPIIHKQQVTNVVVLFKDITKQKRLLELEQAKVKNEQEMLLTLVDMIDKRDSYTAGHTNRVAKYCNMIAKEMGYGKEDIKLLNISAQLHDIGKVATPDSILLKPGNYKKDEYEIMKLHLDNGYELLSQLSHYKEIAQIMRYHHERYDGTGYPQGLKGDEIPPLARIMVVADAFDAMTTNRIYQRKKSVADALQEIENYSQKHFHPEVVEAAKIALRDVVITVYDDQLPKNHIEESRYAYYYKDRLTNLFTIEYLPILIENSYANSQIFLYKAALRNFHQFNLKHSWEKGDQLLIEMAHFLKESYAVCDIFRVEGDDFLILSREAITIEAIKSNLLDTLNGSDIGVDVTQEKLENYLYNEGV